ncbi:MAG: hypothetical protein PHQ59_00530 [Candidatus Daviesbacteria bacterium]|nr:hypothetical protein [Candidatus Daviesbacteria bacterium]
MDIIGYLRQFRIGPFTIFDTLTAYVGIFLVSPLLSRLFAKFNLSVPRSSWLWLTLPIGIIFHLIFQVHSPFMKMLLDPNGNYLSKIVLIFMLFMGLKNIKRIEKVED